MYSLIDNYWRVNNYQPAMRINAISNKTEAEQAQRWIDQHQQNMFYAWHGMQFSEYNTIQKKNQHIYRERDGNFCLENVGKHVGPIIMLIVIIWS